MDDDNWYVAHPNGSVVGPFSKTELLHWLTIWPPQTFVWCGGMTNWLPANAVPGLLEDPAGTNPPGGLQLTQPLEPGAQKSWDPFALAMRHAQQQLPSPEAEEKFVAPTGNPWKDRDAQGTEAVPIRNFKPEFNGLAIRQGGMFFYRVYVRPNENDLVFVWTGTPAIDAATQIKSEQAVTGRNLGMLAFITLPIATTSLEWEKRMRMLTSTPLPALINDHEKNFCAAAKTIVQASIEIPTDSPRGRHQPVLRLTHQNFGPLMMWFDSPDDAHVALEEVPRIFGSKCRVSVEWNGTAFVTKAPDR